MGKGDTMTKEELFKKYNVRGHSNEVWEPTPDNWISVEIYREMHDGELPPQDGSDADLTYILKFLDKTKDAKYFFGLKNPGSMFLTAKRMVYRYADQILEQINPTDTEEI